MAEAAGEVPGTPRDNRNSTPLAENCPRCALQLMLPESNHPNRADYPGCQGYPDSCALTELNVTWATACSFCCEVLPEHTICWARKLEGKFSSTGKALYANFHLHATDWVTKTEDDTPDNARKPSSTDIGKRCQDCLRDANKAFISEGDHLVASCIKPWHVGCVLKRRRQMVEITTEADVRATANSAQISRTIAASRNSTPSKRARESLARGEQLDLS